MDRFVRTWASTKEHMADAAKKMKPREAVHHVISSDLGGLQACTGMGQVPRNRQQVADISRMGKRKSEDPGKKNLSGQERNNDPWYLLLNESKFQARNQDTAFIRDVTVGAEPFCILGTNRQLNDIKRFCCNPTKFRPMTVDPTFDLGPYNVTPISYQHLLVKEKHGEHPTMIGPVLIHEKKSKSTYSRFAATIKSLEPGLINLMSFGTDNEKALVGGFNEHFEKCTHLLCEIHLKKNIEERLLSLNIKGEIKQNIIADIFGRKIGDVFESGISDAKDADELTAMLDSIECKWAAAHRNGQVFHKWFLEKKAKEFAENVIVSVRQRAGLGCPPTKFTTNRSERTNGVIQDFIARENGTAQVDEYTFAKSLQKLIQIQQQEVEMSLLQKGEYTLCKEYQHILVLAAEWEKKSLKQKEASLSQIHKIDVNNVSSVGVATSQLAEDIPSVVKEMILAGVDWITSDILKKIALSAEDKLHDDCTIVEVPTTAAHETVIVPSKSNPTKPHIVTVYSNGKVVCQDCASYSAISLCSHVLAACLKKQRLNNYLKWLTSTKRKTGGINYTSAITYGMPAGRGRKGNKAPRKRGNKQSTSTCTIVRPGFHTFAQSTNQAVSNPSVIQVLQQSTLPCPSTVQSSSVLQAPTCPSTVQSSSVLQAPSYAQLCPSTFQPSPVLQAPSYTQPCPSTVQSSSVLQAPGFAQPCPSTVQPSPIQRTENTYEPSPSIIQPNVVLPAARTHGQQQQFMLQPRPPYPKPEAFKFILYLLAFCPPKTSVCHGCSNSLKPNGVIPEPPWDLVIVSNMERQWMEENILHTRQGNVEEVR